MPSGREYCNSKRRRRNLKNIQTFLIGSGGMQSIK
jgi:hypothetical protein